MAFVIYVGKHTTDRKGMTAVVPPAIAKEMHRNSMTGLHLFTNTYREVKFDGFF